MLDIARIEAGQLALSPEPILIDEALHEALDLVAPLAATGNIILAGRATDTWRRYIQADRQRFKASDPQPAVQRH